VRLSDLRAQLLAVPPEGTEGGFVPVPVGTLAEADAVVFLCPQCATSRGVDNSHEVTIPLRGRRWDPRGWEFGGAGIADLTLRPSIALLRGHPGSCGWHGFVTSGEAA
jgi:hypothetical protein